DRNPNHPSPFRRVFLFEKLGRDVRPGRRLAEDFRGILLDRRSDDLLDLGLRVGRVNLDPPNIRLEVEKLPYARFDQGAWIGMAKQALRDDLACERLPRGNPDLLEFPEQRRANQEMRRKTEEEKNGNEHGEKREGNLRAKIEFSKPCPETHRLFLPLAGIPEQWL